MQLLEKIGFNKFFQDQVDSRRIKDFKIARVITVNKNSFIVSDGEKDIFAELTGKFLFNSDSPLDYPTVGDWAYIQLFDDDSFAVIHELFSRKSLLKRKTPGKKIEYQLIAANVDTALVMQSVDNNFNIRRLERYLVMVYESNIKPIVLLSKCDLISIDETKIKEAEIHKVMQDIPIVAFSNYNAVDTENVKQLLNAGETYCLLGSSGVGKTTLLNNLIHEDLYKTQAIREKDGRGRHTTSRRELIVLENGAMVVDNPGMRELGIIESDFGLSSIFIEIVDLTSQCRFTDCSHTHEQDCAVLNGIESGLITKERYNNYLKMLKEAEYHEMSYVERRKKDKSFGKFVHSVMKHTKDKQ